MIITTPIMRTLLKTLLTSAVLVAALTACESPLDVDTPRIETPLTPAPKVIPRTIELSFETATGSYGFLGTPIIKLDTTVKPIRAWLDIELTESTGSTTNLIDAMRIKADSLAANGLIESITGPSAQLYYNTGSGYEWVYSDAVSNITSILIAEHPREAGEPRQVTITLYIAGNKGPFFPGVPTEEILGTIHLVV